MIFINQIQFSEISINDPLKSLNSQLKNENEDEKFSFVGISNCPLDDIKTDKGIYVYISEFEEKDYFEIGIEIAKSYNDKIIQDLEKRYKEQLKLLSKSYFNFINNIEKDKIDIHGINDFNYLIKIICDNLIKREKGELNLNIFEIIRNSIQRNFGGYKNSIKEFENFIQKEEKNYNISSSINIKECIIQNIFDNKNRYLMLISDNTKSQFLIKLLLNSINRNKLYLIGSIFENDLKSEKYNISLIKKIKGPMKNGNIIIMNLRIYLSFFIWFI